MSESAGSVSYGDPDVDLDVAEVAGALRVSVGMLVRKLKQAPAVGDELTLPETSALSRLDRRGARTAQIARALGAGFTPAELAQLRAVTPLLERLAERL